MRKICVVTGTRADYGIYRPVLRRIVADADLQLRLIACGAHLSPRFGMTVEGIIADGIPVAERLATLDDDDSPYGISMAMSRSMAAIAGSFSRERPDLLLVLGDRYEMFAAVSAAMPFAIPTAHIHGGELTEGLIDEAIRHSITKMSHLHFASTDEYARRIIQMGEAPERVFTTGAPGLDNLYEIEFMTRDDLENLIGISLAQKPLLVTFHPVTLEYKDTEMQVGELCAALENLDCPIVITYPNADTFGTIVIRAVEAYSAGRKNVAAVKNLGLQTYFSLMRIAAAMVGNSSSGIIEAASFGLPVVNIGNRQRGRAHGENVIDCASDRASIAAALNSALDTRFRARLNGMTNPYGDGHSSKRIVDIIKSVSLDAEMMKKRFYNIAVPQ